MEKTKDIDIFFEIDDKNKKIIFIGDTLKVYIPKFFEERELLFIEHKVRTLGIFKLEINEKYESTFLMITFITLNPDKIISIVEEKEEYYLLSFKKGDVFIDNTVIIKDPNLLYKLFMTFIALGKIPKFLNYNNISTIFDNDFLLCGMNLNVIHSIYELIFSHMSRDPDNPFLFYRLSEKIKEPLLIPLHSIAFGPQSATAKIIGSYFGDAINSSMVAPHDPNANYDLENMLRL